MSTNLESIRADIQSFFNTGWGTKTPIQWEQVVYEPTPGTAYVTLWVNAKEAVPSGLGSSKPFRVFGVVQVDINCPINTGIKTITGHADAAATIFLGGQTSSGITFRNMKIYKTVIGVWQRWCLSFNFHKDILA